MSSQRKMSTNPDLMLNAYLNLVLLARKNHVIYFLNVILLYHMMLLMAF
jgi:hypothetical protein